MISKALLGNRNCLFLKMTNIRYLAGFAKTSTHNSGLAILKNTEYYSKNPFLTDFCCSTIFVDAELVGDFTYYSKKYSQEVSIFTLATLIACKPF